MGKIIITTGQYAEKGYVLKNSKHCIYSVEELCYYIVKNPEICEDFLYDTELARFLKEDLGFRERGNLLDDLIERNAPLKDLITVCFCSCDYLTREEMEDFLRERQKLERCEPWVQKKVKADAYLRNGYFQDAALTYEQLLESKDLFGMMEETLGDIYHNLGISRLQIDGFGSAVNYFRLAFEKNRREASLKQYLLALRFLEGETGYETALAQYEVSEDIVRWLDAVYYQTEKETQGHPGFLELAELKELLKQGKMNEFYSGVRRMTERMKEHYRKCNE